MKKYNINYRNQYLSIYDFAELIGFTKSIVRKYLDRSEFSKYWLHDNKQKRRIFILYNEKTYKLFKKFLEYKKPRKIIGDDEWQEKLTMTDSII